MLKSIFLIVSGILLILIPHFVLPITYIKGTAGAQILTLCSIWYHPELYLGLSLSIAGIFSLRYKRSYYAVLPIAALTGIHALVLKPVSYYFQSEIPLVILGQMVSLRAHYGIGYLNALFSIILFATGLFIILKQREKRRFKFSLFHVSSANIQQKMSRSLFLIIGLAIIIGAFFSNILLTQSIENTLETGAGRLGADLMVVPEGEEKEAETVLLSGGPTIFYMKEDILDSLRTFPEVEGVSPQLFLKPFSYLVCCTIESFLIIAYDPVTDFTVSPWIHYTLRKRPEGDEMVVGSLIKFYPGQSIRLFGEEIQVVASLESSGLGYFDHSAFIPIDSVRGYLKELKKRSESGPIGERKKILDESFSHLFPSDEETRMRIEDLEPDGISAIFVKAKDDVSIKELSAKIVSTFDGISVINVRTSTTTVKRHLSSIIRTFLLPLVLLLTMSTIILSVVFSMIVNERQREIGLLRAMGGKKGDIFRLLISEALILTSLGGIFGILFGTGLLFLFKNSIMAALGLLYIWPAPVTVFLLLLATMMVSLAIGIVSSLLPAIKASKMEPYYAIRAAE